jgi:hypothetical protein
MHNVREGRRKIKEKGNNEEIERKRRGDRIGEKGGETGEEVPVVISDSGMVQTTSVPFSAHCMVLQIGGKLYVIFLSEDCNIVAPIMR